MGASGSIGRRWDLQLCQVLTEQVGQRAAHGAEVLSGHHEVVGVGVEVAGHDAGVVQALDGLVVLSSLVLALPLWLLVLLLLRLLVARAPMRT